jgi:hypothetical protein
MKTIRYILRNAYNENKYIYMSLTYNKNKFIISTGYKTNAADWNPRTQRIINNNTYNATINKYLDLLEIEIVNYVNTCIIQCKSITYSDLKQIIDLITNNALRNDLYKVKENALFSRDRYFSRFYEFFSNHGDMIRAYYEVEGEWNDAGVSMCPTYEAFKVAKHRYIKNKKKGFKIRSI